MPRLDWGTEEGQRRQENRRRNGADCSPFVPSIFGRVVGEYLRSQGYLKEDYPPEG